MRVTLFTSSLEAGGAERSVTVLAEELAKRDHDVTVVTWNAPEQDFYSLPGTVVRTRVPLDKQLSSVKWYDIPANLKRILSIRNTISASAPDIVIGFLDGSNELLLLSSLGKRFCKLISCQNNLMLRRHYNRRWDLLRRYTYRLADCVAFLDSDMAKEMQSRYPAWTCRSVPNPLVRVDKEPDDSALRILRAMDHFPRRLVAMGRLVNQKGFDLLLRAFARVVECVDDVGLIILGDGPLRGDLEALCRDLELDDRVVLPGRTKKPHAVIAHCDLFVFSSRYEGQGMALAEAMACGVATVSFDCPFGPRSMIESTGGGILIPREDVESMSSAIVELLRHEERRLHYAENAQRITEYLAPHIIAERWETLFEACQ